MKKYKLLLLGLIVLGTFLGNFHHHDDNLLSSDCQVCIVKHNIDVSNGVDSFSLKDINTKIDTIYLHTYNYQVRHLNLNTFSRAPPFYS